MPWRVMAGIIRLPMAEDCAMALPEIPANSMLASTVTSDNPPLKCPTSALAKFTMRALNPPKFIRLPASRNKGIVSSTN